MYACAPNLADYVSFLQNVVAIPGEFLPTATGTATVGSNSTLVDTTQNWAFDMWAGCALTIGTTGVFAQVQSNTATQLNFTTVSGTVNAGDVYWITPQVVNGSLYTAQSTVNCFLQCTGMFTFAVYNLATDRLINYAPDVNGQTYFKDKRCELKINNTSLWITSGASDQGTSQQGMIPKQFEHFTMADLQSLRTPWGRQYLEIAQSVGTLWGVS